MSVDNFVVDNSVVMSWCFKDETNNYADKVLDRLIGAAAVVPSIWPLEVVNVLLAAERQKRLSESDSIRFLNLLSQLPLVVEYERPETMQELLALGRTNNLSSYDASYLNLAMKKGLPLATHPGQQTYRSSRKGQGPDSIRLIQLMNQHYRHKYKKILVECRSGYTGGHMPGSIFIIQNDDILLERTRLPYATEDHLQLFLEMHSALPAGEQADAAAPRCSHSLPGRYTSRIVK